jgi:hypothetical protein
MGLFSRKPKLHPIIQRAPLRGTVDRNELGEALAPKTLEQRRAEWRDRFLAANPDLTPDDLLNLEAQGLTVLSKWKSYRRSQPEGDAGCATSCESS